MNAAALNPKTRAVRDALGRFVSHRLGTEFLDGNDYDLDAVWASLGENRLLNVCYPQFGRMAAELDDYRDLTWSLNTSALLTIMRISKLLGSAKIPHVFIKGPLAIREAFEDYFFRPSADVDMLVCPSDFDRVDALLVRDGFTVAPGSRSLYWRSFLGEQHFEPPIDSLSTVDLHKVIYHPVWQRRSVENLIGSVELRNLAGQMIPVPGTADAFIIMVSYLIKSLMKREPAGHYLLEAALLLRKMSPVQRSELELKARRHGLGKALPLILAVIAFLQSDEDLTYVVDHRPKPCGAEANTFNRWIDPDRAPPVNRAGLLVAISESYRDVCRVLLWEIGRWIAQKGYHFRLF